MSYNGLEFMTMVQQRDEARAAFVKLARLIPNMRKLEAERDEARRIARRMKAERDTLRERCADLELRLDAYNGNMMDVLEAENAALKRSVLVVTKDAEYWHDACLQVTAERDAAIKRAAEAQAFRYAGEED